jgi:hypothetical protein
VLRLSLGNVTQHDGTSWHNQVARLYLVLFSSHTFLSTRDSCSTQATGLTLCGCHDGLSIVTMLLFNWLPKPNPGVHCAQGSSNGGMLVTACAIKVRFLVMMFVVFSPGTSHLQRWLPHLGFCRGASQLWHLYFRDRSRLFSWVGTQATLWM